MRVILILISISVTFCLKNDPSIIIIGAGSAGIAAATKLIENDFKNVKILEAESRIGGRIYSVKFGDAFIDLGAEWCHGEKDNIVYDLVKDLGILRHTEFTEKFYLLSGKAIDDKLSSEIFNIMYDVYSADGSRDVSDQVTVGHYCIKNYNETLYKKYGNDKDKLDLALSTMEYFEHSVLGYEGSFSWFEPAARNDYRDCEGDLQLNWNGLGYKTILEIMMKFPIKKREVSIKSNILLNKEVEKIYWKSNRTRNAVTIRCSDGSNFTADHVIFTPSVGVLKEKSFTMFQPSLSDEKQKVIGNIGFGAVMKVAVHFPKHWWGDEHGFNFVWTIKDKWSVLRDLPNDPHWMGKSWVTYLFTLEDTPNNSNVMIAWFTGNFVPVMEQLSDDMLINGIYYVLKRFLSNQFQISKPDKIIKSQWYSNPHFRGAYSFQTIKCMRGNGTTSENILAKPLVNAEKIPIVQFAGEATHPYYFSTVHGAIETGYREADVLIHLYFKNF